MKRPILTHKSRCLVVAAGGVLERCIEDRARTIASSRSAEEITPEDIEKATAEFLRDELANLPRFLERAMNKYRHRPSKAA